MCIYFSINNLHDELDLCFYCGYIKYFAIKLQNDACEYYQVAGKSKL